MRSIRPALHAIVARDDLCVENGDGGFPPIFYRKRANGYRIVTVADATNIYEHQ